MIDNQTALLVNGSLALSVMISSVDTLRLTQFCKLLCFIYLLKEHIWHIEFSQVAALRLVIHTPDKRWYGVRTLWAAKHMSIYTPPGDSTHAGACIRGVVKFHTCNCNSNILMLCSVAIALYIFVC